MPQKHRNDKDFDHQSDNQHRADGAQQFLHSATHEEAGDDELLDPKQVGDGLVPPFGPHPLSPLLEHGEKYHQAGKTRCRIVYQNI